MEMVFACKQCKKVFRKDMAEWDDATDSFCPYCDNKFVLEARIAPTISNTTTTITSSQPDLRDGSTLVLDPRVKQPTLEELEALQEAM